MAVVALDHINIGTDQLARTQAFFCDVLGLTPGWRPDFGVGGAWLYTGGHPVVHLVELKTAKAPSSDAALDHFAFRIDDYDDAVRRLEAAGMTFRAVSVPGTDVRQIFVRELNGVVIELNWNPGLTKR